MIANAWNGQSNAYPVLSMNKTTGATKQRVSRRDGWLRRPWSSLKKRQPWPDEPMTDNESSTECFDTGGVAYVGVAIDFSYRAAFDADAEVKRNIIDVVKTASVVFENSFNITLAFRDLIISSPECSDTAYGSHPWDVSCAQGELNWRLDRFTAWRAGVEDDNAIWTLMTGCAAPAGEIGVSWVGEVCKLGEDYDGLDFGIGANIVGHSDTEWQVSREIILLHVPDHVTVVC
ncbi:Metallo-peptidase family M12-domain-containing protein [Aspergillus stella-maris]|uniref:Metallo-peptidase family M12-domain-containing protein n=1 Tax=Aspergillus stella-maris TaxID=1810926 RepID=UPI003CCD679B